MNRQVQIKCEQIARMIVKGWPKTRIAIEMGMSYDGLMGITRRPEYLEIEEEVRSGVVGKMDARLARRAAMRNEISEEVEDTVPDAMRVILESVTKKRDLRAALEVLDRDPKRQFAKASRPLDDTTGAGPRTGLESEALAQAVREADVTHKMVTAPVAAAQPTQSSSTQSTPQASQVKPAEA